MTRTVFAMAVAALLLAAVPATSQAAPIAPLGAAITADQGNLTQVRWWGWHRWHPYWHPYWRWHRRCWVGRWGRWHCW